MIQVKDGFYYLGIWWASYPEEVDAKGDFMACAYRPVDKPMEWTIQYRFRTYKDDKAFDSGDSKEWFTVRPTGTESYIESSIKNLMMQCLMPDFKFIEIRGSAQRFIEAIEKSGLDFLHVQKHPIQ